MFYKQDNSIRLQIGDEVKTGFCGNVVVEDIVFKDKVIESYICRNTERNFTVNIYPYEVRYNNKEDIIFIK